MKYKNFLYRLSSLFSPNFYKEISDLLSEKNSITIFDIGFYSGDFTIKLVRTWMRMFMIKIFQSIALILIGKLIELILLNLQSQRIYIGNILIMQLEIRIQQKILLF